jgi:allophanate hydrolase subunit 2
VLSDYKTALVTGASGGIGAGIVAWLASRGIQVHAVSRNGARLEELSAKTVRSHGLLPGVIQAPNGGTPIIQLADAFTAGGYPKIGTVIAADLWRVAQAPLGSALRFVQVDYAAACAAQAAFDADCARVRMWIDLCRSGGA